MKLPGECNSLEDIRKEIDNIDSSIIELIARRLSYVREIIKYKKSEDDVLAAKRYNDVIHDRRSRALQNDLDPDIIENIYRILMNYFIQVQLKLLKKNK